MNGIGTLSILTETSVPEIYIFIVRLVSDEITLWVKLDQKVKKEQVSIVVTDNDVSITVLGENVLKNRFSKRVLSSASTWHFNGKFCIY